MDSYKPGIATILSSLYDESVAKMVRLVVCGKMGYNLIDARNDDEAKPLVGKSHVVLSDVSNGGYDLYDYTRRNCPQVRFIFIDGGLLERARVPDALVLPKPINIAELVRVIDSVVPQDLKPAKPQ